MVTAFSSSAARWGLAVAMFGAALMLLLSPDTRLPTRDAARQGAPSDDLASRVFIVFDEAQGTPVRKVYKVWDPDPARKLEFAWAPDDARSAVAGPVSGTGVLTWRVPGRASLDPEAVVSVYRGGMRDGRAEGRGEFRSRDGVRYEGWWHRGLYEGQGQLQLADTTRYEGEFKAGKYGGRGTLVLADGQTYIGPFRRGLRHGLGRTRLQSGASYESIWDNDVEVDGTRRVVVAQGSPLGAVPLQFSEGDLRISVSVDQSDEVLSYFAKNEADAISIVPDDKALMAAWKFGGSISELDLEIPPVASRIGLLLRVKNLGRRPITIVGGSLSVDQSRVDLQPLLMSWYDSSGCNSRPLSNTQVSFTNYGLADPVSAALVLGFTRSENPFSLRRPSLEAQHDVSSIRFNRFEASYDFKASLSQAGVATQQLVAWSDMVTGADRKKKNDALPCGAESDEACLQKLIAMGVLGKLAPAVRMSDGALKTTVAGWLKYSWQDVDGIARRYSAPFSHEVVLGCRRQFLTGAEFGDGGIPERDVASWTMIDLQMSGRNYQLPFPASAVIPRGGVQGYRLLLSSRKSSQHMFRVAFRGPDGAVYSSKPIKLQTFIPR